MPVMAIFGEKFYIPLLHVRNFLSFKLKVVSIDITVSKESMCDREMDRHKKARLTVSYFNHLISLHLQFALMHKFYFILNKFLNEFETIKIALTFSVMSCTLQGCNIRHLHYAFDCCKYYRICISNIINNTIALNSLHYSPCILNKFQSNPFGSPIPKTHFSQTHKPSDEWKW